MSLVLKRKNLRRCVSEFEIKKWYNFERSVRSHLRNRKCRLERLKSYYNNLEMAIDAHDNVFYRSSVRHLLSLKKKGHLIRKKHIVKMFKIIENSTGKDYDLGRIILGNLCAYLKQDYMINLSYFLKFHSLFEIKKVVLELQFSGPFSYEWHEKIY